MNSSTGFPYRLPPEFDAAWYAARYPDVALSGLSPEDHFLRFGRVLGRASCAAAEPAPADPPATVPMPEKVAARFGADPTALPKVPPVRDGGASPLVARPDDLSAPVSRARMGSGRPALVDGVSICAGATEIGRARDPRDAAGFGALGWLCAMLPRLGDGLALRAAGGQVETFAPRMPDGLRLAPAALRDGPARIDRVALVADGTLRIALSGSDPVVSGTAGSPESGLCLRAYQPDPADPSVLRPCGEVCVPDDGPGWGDLDLVSGLMPLLLELADETGRTLCMGLLPYPSLAEGGLHAAELAAHRLLGHPMDELWRLSEALLDEHLGRGPGGGSDFAIGALNVDLDGATGAEPVFSRPVREWLAALFGLLPLPGPPSFGAETPGRTWVADALRDREALPAALRQVPGLRPGTRSGTLLLPPDSVPTISALVSRGLTLPHEAGGVPGPFLVATPADRTPLWSVSVPTSAAGRTRMSGRALAIPVLTGPDHDRAAAASGSVRNATIPLHLAVAFRGRVPAHDNEALFPLAPDAGVPVFAGLNAVEADVDVSVAAEDPAASLRFVEALAQQSLASQLRVTVWAGPGGTAEAEATPGWQAVERALRTGFAGRSRLVYSHRPSLVALAAESTSDWLIVADDAVVPYDPRLVASLLALASRDAGTASVAPSHLTETKAGKATRLDAGGGGLFPAGVSFVASPQLAFSEFDIADALPGSVYPVYGNSLDFALLRVAAIRDVGPAGAAGPWQELQLAGALAARGWSSLCTTAIRTVRIGGRRRLEAIDPFGLACLSPAGWEELLAGVTVVRDLR